MYDRYASLWIHHGPNDKTRLVSNERAESVKMMYQWALQGESAQQISTRLNHMELPIPKAEYYQNIGRSDVDVYPKYDDFGSRALSRAFS